MAYFSVEIHRHPKHSIFSIEFWPKWGFLVIKQQSSWGALGPRAIFKFHPSAFSNSHQIWEVGGWNRDRFVDLSRDVVPAAYWHLQLENTLEKWKYADVMPYGRGNTVTPHDSVTSDPHFFHRNANTERYHPRFSSVWRGKLLFSIHLFF